MALVDSENCRKEEEKSHLPSVLPNEDKSLPVASVESEISEKEEDDPEFCKIMEEVLQLYEKVNTTGFTSHWFGTNFCFPNFGTIRRLPYIYKSNPMLLHQSKYIVIHHLFSFLGEKLIHTYTHYE
ncbi:uncharacterized protein DS421_18g610220 [Arachis hypogaea]|nr:uncharacterized protein DS421_18g610220 [Arachis hypogaea]